MKSPEGCDRRPRGAGASAETLLDAFVARLEGGPDAALLAYQDRPLEFVREVLGQTLWARQEQALLALFAEPRVTIRSAHGVGKTFVAACAALWWVLCHRPSLALTTAPTQRQVESLLWGEIHRLWSQAPTPLPGVCTLSRLKASPEQQALGLTTREPERFAGWHNEHMLVIVDEASGVPDPIFEVIQGTLTSAHCRLLLIGNPTRAEGYFAQSHRSPGWSKLKISAYDTPNFGDGVISNGDRSGATPGEVISDAVTLSAHPITPSPHHPIKPYPCPWLVTPAWVQARQLEWGEASDPFRVRVLGEFPQASADTLIELAWVEAAEARDCGLRIADCGLFGPPANPQSAIRNPQSTVLGVDVARFGDCETVVVERAGDQVIQLTAWQGADLMESCGRLVARCRVPPGTHAVGDGRARRPVARIVVDAVGLGAGVVDRLRELQREGERSLLGVELVAFESGSRALLPEQFISRRDEAYLSLRDRFRDGRIALPPGLSRLTGQLTALKYHYSSRGALQVESKGDLRRRGIASPDQADALALAFAPVAAGPAYLPTALGGRRTVHSPLPRLSD